MQYAMTSSFEKILPSKGLTAVCPQCENEVIAKCGNINVWHWAHKTLLNCKYFERNETEWHRNWKARFPEQCREVRFPAYDSEGNKTAHIADVYSYESETAIEFQHSRITPNECMQRNEFYTGISECSRLSWIIDISDANYTFEKDVYIKRKNEKYDSAKEDLLFHEMEKMQNIKNLVNSLSHELVITQKKRIQNEIDLCHAEINKYYREYIKNKEILEKTNTVILKSKKDIVMSIWFTITEEMKGRIHCYLDSGKGNIACIDNVINYGSYLLIEFTDSGIVSYDKVVKFYTEIISD